MLEEADRELFARLSVFVGGAGLDEIESVCSGEGGDTLDGLTSLTEKSLVRQAEGVEGESRFTMLETIREFAIEQAKERGQWDALRERHARAFAELAHEAAGHVMGEGSRASLDRLDLEHDNLRAALAWSMEHDTEAALRPVPRPLALLAAPRPPRRGPRAGRGGAGSARCRRRIRRRAPTPSRRRPVLPTGGQMPTEPGRTTRPRSRLARRSGIEPAWLRPTTGSRSRIRSWTCPTPDTADNAKRYITAALEIYTELGDDAGIGRCEWALANVLWGTLETSEARARALHALELFEATGDQFMVGWASYTARPRRVDSRPGSRGQRRSPRRGGRRRFEQAMRTFREAGDLSGLHARPRRDGRPRHSGKAIATARRG